MANVQINQLPAATLPLDGTELIPADQGIQTVQVTLEDVKNYINETPVLPYQVYTALLTQNGGNNPQDWDSGSGPLILGYTYQITNNDGGTADFTNVGAPNNNVGTYFVATGTTPNSWGDSDNGGLSGNEAAPVVTVLQNTIGNIWFTYDDVGAYYVNSDALFISNKTALFGGSTYYADDTTRSFGFNFANNNLDTSILLIQSIVINADTKTNDIFKNAPIEIRVYP